MIENHHQLQMRRRRRNWMRIPKLLQLQARAQTQSFNTGNQKRRKSLAEEEHDLELAGNPKLLDVPIAKMPMMASSDPSPKVLTY
jgi:hypothetical protein